MHPNRAMSEKKTYTLERLKQVAAKAFREQRFEQVSIARIAADANCSTATIYQIFGSKSALFMEVASQGVLERPHPKLRPSSEASLFGLLEYANERLEWLSGPSPLGFVRSAAELRPYPGLLTLTTQREQFVGLRDEVQRLMDCGLLRRSDARATAYSICAGVGFDTMALQLTLGDEACVDNNEVIKLVFTPLVTDEGEAQLGEFLARNVVAAQRVCESVKLYELI
jgi:AcrR family transcriptional regulator